MAIINTLLTVVLTFAIFTPTVLTLSVHAEEPPKSIHLDVLILGGGMTGIAAAHHLYHDSKISNFLIVEARHELGGRVQNGRIGDMQIELGANWIEGLGENPIWKLAQKFKVDNVLSVWEDIDYFNGGGWDGENGPLQNAVTQYEEVAFFAAAADAGKRKSLGLTDLNMKAGLRLNGWNPSTPEERAAEYFSHDWEYAEPPVLSSFFGTVDSYNENFVESGSDIKNIVIDQKGGYKKVITGHASEIPDISKKVLYNTTITRIAYNASGVTAYTKEGLTIHAKKAICTFSLGVLQHDDVTFSPALPGWKREAIANFHMATYLKLFLRFPTKFWNDTQFSLYADQDERGNFPVWQSFEAPGFFPGSKILFATVTSDQAYRAEYQTDKEVKEDLLIVLRNMYGAGNVPEPVEFVVKRWTLDPLFRGTFTNWGAGATVKQQLDMRAPLGGELDRERTLWFSGEHTSRKYYGYLHGAYWEGKLAAADVADCLLRGCRESADTKKVKRDEGGEAGGVVERSTGTGRSGKRRMWT